MDSKAVIRVALRLVELTLDAGALMASGRSTSTDVRCPLNSTGTAIYLPLKVSAFVQSPLAQDGGGPPGSGAFSLWAACLFPIVHRVGQICGVVCEDCSY